MFFTLLDIVLVVFIVFFAAAGFFFGLISALGALVGVILGAWVAGQYYPGVADFILPYVLGNAVLADIVAFILVFTVVNRAVAIVFWFINKIFHLISVIPFLKSINRFGGIVLGLIEGVLVMGLLIYVIAKFAGHIEWVMSQLNGSQVAQFLVWLTGFLTYLLPEVINKAVSIF